MAEPKTIEELSLQLAELQNAFSASQEKNEKLVKENEELRIANGALSEQNRALQTGLGLSGATKGLPKEVIEDIQARQELGLSAAAATEAALRQHRHNIATAKKNTKEAKK